MILYAIPARVLHRLIEGEALLTMLECYGLKDWSGYDEAIKSAIKDWKEEYDIPEEQTVTLDEVMDEEIAFYENKYAVEIN